PLNPQSRAASASSSSAKTSTADSASGGTGPSHATSQEAGDMSAGPLGPISDGESILPDATAAPSTPKSVAARGVGGGGNGPFSVMSPPPPSSAASSRASAYFTPEGRNAAMGTASASQNRGNRGGSTNTNFSQSLPRSLWNIAGSPSTGDPGGGGDPGPGGTIDEMDGETTAPTKPPTGSWFSSCVDADFEPSPLSAAASPAPAAPFGGDSSASNGGVRFTFGVASPSGADSAGVQANGKADGYTSCATRMGVGSGGKAVPAQKVNPPRFAFGEQARRSEVGGGDGGNDSFAQKFMQHQREHRREQEGSEQGRGYSQPAAGCETVPPPAPRGTGFSFGQASPAPSTSTRGSGKRRASTRNLLKKPQPQQQQQTRQGVASSIAMDKDGTAAQARNIGRNASAASAAAGGTVASGVGGGVSGGGSVGGGADAIMQAWLRGKEAEAQREREEKQKAAREQQQRLEAAAKLDRLRKRHEADKESARRTYMDKCFEAASVEYTTAIASLEELLQHVAAHGDGRGPGGGKPIPGDGGRGRLAPLYWSRAAAHIMSGRYRSAVIDCSMALNAEPEWAQAYPRMGKALLMAGDLHGADEAFKKGTM
ncbi:unnamed protein product, partial [Sphacelaria rigidula]